MPEAVVPMPGGRIPIGRDSSGFFAHLPGNRKVPASMFADGGVLGGQVASSVGGYGSVGGMNGGAGGDTFHNTTVVQLDGQEIARHTHVHNRAELMGEMLGEARPGGKLRRALSVPR